MSQKQLIINPGSTSTKLALYDGEQKLLQSSIEHKPEQLLAFEKIGDQVPFRLALIRDFMAQNGVKGEDLSAVIGRGGLVFGLKMGGYEVNDFNWQAIANGDYKMGDLKTPGETSGILWPFAINTGGAVNTDYEIIYLDGQLMTLIGNYNGAGEWSWSECTWWRFQPKR